MLSDRSEVKLILGTVLTGARATYYIHEVIGEGGQGWVFKASYDDIEGFPVVVKILRPDATTKDALDRFRREADILRRLATNNPSPYIVRFFDHGEAPFPLPEAPSERAMLPFTVLEYVHGDTLQAILDRQRGQGLAVGRVRRIAREVAKALEIVHGEGVVHRDLKPSNILMSSEAGREVAKVTDFGLVKVVDLRATATQSLAGVSLSYAPPEQYEPGNPRVGPHTDVFSYAAILYELLSGREAFPSTKSNPFEALRLIATSKRPKLLDRVTSLPLGLRERGDLIQKLDALIEHALSPEPADRPKSIEEFYDAIDPILREADGKGPGDVTGKMSTATQPLHGHGVSMPPREGSPPTPQSMARPVRAPVSDPSDPRAWSWRQLAPGAAMTSPGGGSAGPMVRDAIIEDAPHSVVIVGGAGLVRWTSSSGWTPVPLGFGILPNEMRCLGKLPQGAFVVAGERGMIAFLHGGALWDVRRFPDADITFHAIGSDVNGARILAVGERTSRGHAVAVELTSAGWRRTFDLTDLGPLRGVAYLDAQTVYACGDGGALIRIDEQGLARIPWERTGHLRAIAASPASRSAPATILAVGTGGHALGIGAAPPPATTARIEKVMTTQDLLGACIAPDGAGWASSANARILRRDGSGTWRRVTADFPASGNLLRIGSTGARTLVVADDATILEGVLNKA